ncbi:alkaline phosphatase family protein [Candidatus Gottesmanbacteria bacterium]|nr:alkaline phosphatase family protein [Candidatus Gottesmanbacteria bacterium]
MKRFVIVMGLVIVILLIALALPASTRNTYTLYWFIPDGVRAEPSLFTVFKWAQEDKLPNIKKLMAMGSYGYSYPNFPSHTPTNFAALLTGSYPEVNGVDDGPMRAIGKPLDAVAVPGFRSTAKKVPPIWVTLEKAGLKVAIISVPGSTPPEIQKGLVVRGRWGGWGPDFFALNFETKGDLSQRIMQGRAARFFYFGPQLTNYIDDVAPSEWTNPPTSFSPAREVTMEGWGAKVYAYIYDSTNDGKTDYDHAAFSLDKKTIFADITPGGWSNWQPITLKWKTQDASADISSQVKLTLIKLGGSNGFFRIRLLYNTINAFTVFPKEAADLIVSAVGPQVDFADNFPAQLIYYPEDKQTFQDEAGFSFDWHTKAVRSILSLFKPNVVIHDIYTPNQMLTSRWWMAAVDPKSATYNQYSAADREKLWTEVQDMYKKLDGIIGEILTKRGPNSFIVLSSDHGAVPLNTYVNLNNLFAQKGWLKFQIDPKTGEPGIDWKNSQVIYLKMAHVYINPNGLAGDYQRANGPAYEKLRNDVIAALKGLRDTDGVSPLADVVTWEHAKDYLQMDPDRAGDLIIANAPGYGWNEEMTADLKIFSTPAVSGYKQAIKAKDDPGMWTPFIIAGPGIKKNHFIGDAPFPLVDQYPTIMKALKIPIPDFVQGHALDVFGR